MVCGSRSKKDYRSIVYDALHKYFERHDKKDIMIIEGCCECSADEYVEDYARVNNISIQHNPSQQGDYLNRDRAMVMDCDEVLAFWDGFSYGTAYTVAQAVLHKKPVTMIGVRL